MNQPETVVAQWQESQPQGRLASPHFILLSLVGVVVLTILLIIGGIYAKDSIYYLGAAAAVALGLMLVTQNRALNQTRNITLTTMRLVIGKNSTPLATLAGFWLEKVDDHCVINIEATKPRPFPISILYPSPSLEEVRTLLLPVLNEVEPREPTWADSLSRLIHL